MLPLAAALIWSVVRAASAADYPSTVLADNPIAYYRLEETSGTTAVDSSASGAFPGVYVVNGGIDGYQAGPTGVRIGSVGFVG